MSNYIPANLPGTIQTAENNISTNTTNITALQNEFFTTTLNGTWSLNTATSGNVDVLINQVGNIIHVCCNTIGVLVAPAVSAPYFEFSQTIPVDQRPSANSAFFASVVDSGTFTNGSCIIQSNGVIRIYRSADFVTNFTPLLNAGFSNNCSFSYGI